MKILFLDYLLKNLGAVFTIIFLFYLCLMSIRFVSLYNVLRHAGTTPLLPFLKDQFDSLKKACATSNALLVENRIEQLWIDYENMTMPHFSAINSYVYSIILWGFTGTIWGTIKAFSKMGESLFEKDIQAAEALSSALQGGLNIALYTSLVAATIGAVTVTFIYSKYMFEKSKHIETQINEQIYRVVEEGQRDKGQAQRHKANKSQ